MLETFFSAGVCLLIVLVLFSTSFRQIGMLRPIALFFLFEGIWIMIDYIVTQTSLGTEATQKIHCVGIIVFGGYMLLCLLYSRPKKEKNERNGQSDRKKRPSRSKHINIEDRPQQ